MTQSLKPLTIDLKYPYMIVSIDYSGYYLQVCIPPWLGKFFRFTVLRLLNKSFLKLSLPSCHDLIISPPCKLPPINLPEFILESFFEKKQRGEIWEGYYALSSYLFPFLKVLSLSLKQINFCGTNYGLLKKLSNYRVFQSQTGGS